MRSVTITNEEFVNLAVHVFKTMKMVGTLTDDDRKKFSAIVAGLGFMFTDQFEKVRHELHEEVK